MDERERLNAVLDRVSRLLARCDSADRTGRGHLSTDEIRLLFRTPAPPKRP